MKKHKNKHKKHYHVKNWRQYNEALVQRGSLEVWLSPESHGTWYARATGTPGAPAVYSDAAITCALSIRKLFHLPLRQTEGFIRSAFTQSATVLTAPDYSTLSRRGRYLLVKLPKKNKAKTIIVVDSSGVKVYGAGEWNTKRHGKKKAKRWKKIHIAIDETGEVRAADVSDEDTADAEVTESLLNQEDAQITGFWGDGAYDKRRVYRECLERQVAHIVIPPRTDAKIWQHGNTKAVPHPRDENLRAIRHGGRKRWKEQSGYHLRSLVESTMFRFKTIFGDRVFSREDSRQRTELTLAFAMLNRMFELGRPESYVVTT